VESETNLTNLGLATHQNQLAMLDAIAAICSVDALKSTVNDWNIVSSKRQTLLNSLNCVEIEDAAMVGSTTIRGGEPTGRQQMFMTKRALELWYEILSVSSPSSFYLLGYFRI
jgi:hypothetical protein